MTSRWPKDAVLVTGASGFIGDRVARSLFEAGRGVIGTDLAPPRSGAPTFPFYAADIRDSVRHAAVIAKNCTAIVHCGGISGPMLLADNPAELLDINVRGSVQLLEIARRFGLDRFVNLSSVSAYGSTPGLGEVTESAPLRASTVYGTSKAATDLVVQTYVAQYGLRAVSLRVGWVYGPGRMTDTYLRLFARSAVDRAFELGSGADHLLQFVHVDDVVWAIVSALDATTLAEAAYNIDGEEVLPLGEIARLVIARAPTARISIGPGLLDGVDIQGKIMLGAAQRDLHWRPKVSFNDGLGAYIDWLKDHRF